MKDKGDRLFQLIIYCILFLLSYSFLVIINKSFNLFLVSLFVNFLTVERVGSNSDLHA